VDSVQDRVGVSFYEEEASLLQEKGLTIREASRRAIQTLVGNQEIARLYRKAVKRFGEGDLQTGILNLVTDAIEDEALQQEIFSNDQSMLSFFCGVWIQFLLVEIAGVDKETLRALAKKIYEETYRSESIH
jgi:hypothetical protein